jgi:hypothetical protein
MTWSVCLAALPTIRELPASSLLQSHKLANGHHPWVSWIQHTLYTLLLYAAF